MPEPNDPKADALVSFHDATVMRAGRAILHIDELEIAAGESVAILGPNGAGKSTFVQLVTREVLPLHREAAPVRFLGQERATLADVKQRIGCISATMQAQVDVHLPALEVVEGGFFGALGIPLRKQASPEQEAMALRVMAELGIADLAERDMTTLSSGQARRVLIARALVHGPSALVVDEPCTGLDPHGMHAIRSTMRTIARSGRSLILVTHYLEDIVPEIDRVILIKDGAIIEDGPKERVLTSERVSELFDCPLEASRSGAYYELRMRY